MTLKLERRTIRVVVMMMMVVGDELRGRWGRKHFSSGGVGMMDLLW
jgi:hypothetical protein